MSAGEGAERGEGREPTNTSAEQQDDKCKFRQRKPRTRASEGAPRKDGCVVSSVGRRPSGEAEAEPGGDGGEGHSLTEGDI